MIFEELKTKGAYIITFDPHRDHRGYFVRTYDKKIFQEKGLDKEWVQESQSFSKNKGTTRGLHFQAAPHAETKLVRAVHGEVFMVVVDIRKNSDTFGKWDSVTLSQDNMKMLYVPEGFALGMCTITDNVILAYKIDRYYVPESQRIIKWDDKDISIRWPVKEPIISDRDNAAGSFKDFIMKMEGTGN